MSEPLRSYADLVLQAQRGVDYDLAVCDRGAAVTVLTLRGGGIAPPLGELVVDVAGEAWNSYVLRGLRNDGRETDGNAALRLPSLRFAELRHDGLVSRSELALCLADDTDEQDAIRVGGANARLVEALLSTLAAAGLAAEAAPNRVERLALQGYNRARQGGAVLLIPQGLRRALSAGSQTPEERTTRYGALVGAAQRALAECLAAQNSDLRHTLARFENTTRAVQDAGVLRQGARHRHG